MEGFLQSGRARDMRFSNFMLTLSTNVVPQNIMERMALTRWLLSVTEEMFDDWSVLNGAVLKPAGTANSERHRFGDDHKIISVKSRVAVEKGETKGQIHAHCLLEVCHSYTKAERGQRYVGVHVNRDGVQEYLDAHIPYMEIPFERRPKKIYVNCRLLTKGTDNSNKWLTLAYINKDRDVHGTNLAAQRARASERELRIAEELKRPDSEFNTEID